MSVRLLTGPAASPKSPPQYGLQLVKDAPLELSAQSAGHLYSLESLFSLAILLFI